MTDFTTYTCKHGLTPILSVRNYHSWKNNITNLLAMDDSLEIVFGLELAPASNATAQARDFRKQLQRAFGMIWSSTEPSIRMFLNHLGCHNPHAAWEVLRERYDVAASQCTGVATLACLHSAVMKPVMSVLGYISSLSDISQELEGTPDEVVEQYLIMRIFVTLSEQFTNIVDIHKNGPIEEQILNSISTILIEHKTPRALCNTTTGSNLNLAGTSSNALSANIKVGKHHRTNGKDKYHQKPYNKRQATSDPRNITCYYCTRKGHKAIDCEVRKKATEMKQGSEDKHGKSASTHHVITGDTVVHGLTAMARVAGNTGNTDEWIIDSGATHHFSPNLMDFHEYHPLEESLQVESADSVCFTTASSSIILQLDCGMLVRVETLYVPDFGASLLSVPQLIKDSIDVCFHTHLRTAYITSEDFTEQPLGRCASGSMSFVLLGNITLKRSHSNATVHQANVQPRLNSDSVPQSNSDSAPWSNSDSAPQSNSDSAPWSNSNSVPRSN